MQGHSSPLESGHLTSGFGHGSSNHHLDDQCYLNFSNHLASSSANTSLSYLDMDGQGPSQLNICTSCKLSSGSNHHLDDRCYLKFSDHLASSSANTPLSYLNMDGQGPSQLNIDASCDLSSDSYAIQNVHSGNNSKKVMHEPFASFTVDTGGREDAVRSTDVENRAIDLNSNVCDAGLTYTHDNYSQNIESDDLATLALGLCICLPPVNHLTSTSVSSVPHANPSSVSSLSAYNDAADGRKGKTFVGKNLSCKRKNSEVSGGSSSCVNATFSSASNVELGQRDGNTDMRLGYEHCLASAGSAESSRRNIRMRAHSTNQHGGLIYSPLVSGNGSIHPCAYPSHQSSAFAVTPNHERVSRPVVRGPVPRAQPQSVPPSGLAVQVPASQNQPQSPAPRPTLRASSFQSMPRPLISIPSVPVAAPSPNLAPLIYAPTQIQNRHSVERLLGNSSSTTLDEQLNALREQINTRSNTRDPNNLTTIPQTVPPSIINRQMARLIRRQILNRNTYVSRSLPSISQDVTYSGARSAGGSNPLPHENPHMGHARAAANVVHQALVTHAPSEFVTQGSNLTLSRNDNSTLQGGNLMLPRNDNSTLQGSGYQPVAIIQGNQPQINRLRTAVLGGLTNSLPTLSVPVRSSAAGNRLSEGHFIPHNSIVLNAANRYDRYRDMRLNIDGMSYEELLVLGERIGNVSTGLDEETTLKHLKRQKCSLKFIEARGHTVKPCCICWEEYIIDEDLGVLWCGHDFHTGCIKQWLKQKNLCPICRATAIPNPKGRICSVH